MLCLLRNLKRLTMPTSGATTPIHAEDASLSRRLRQIQTHIPRSSFR